MRVFTNLLFILAVFSLCCSSKPTIKEEKGGEMKEVFYPVVAGSFYPAIENEVRSMLDKFDKQIKRVMFWG